LPYPPQGGRAIFENEVLPMEHKQSELTVITKAKDLAFWRER